MQLSVEMGVPIIVVVQSNRGGVKEDANAFRNLYKEYFSMMDYANGDLPTRNICGYDFVEVSHTVSTGDYGMRVTSYVYRHEAASMTVHITFGESGDPDDFEGWALFDNFTFELPDLGLSDPPFEFLSGEPKTEVKELDLSGYKVTPVQGHFSERVYTASDTYSSTATQVAASDKYLYTFENKGSIVTVYQINGEEMTKVTEIAYEESTVTVNLLDNDTVTFIPDPERTHAFKLKPLSREQCELKREELIVCEAASRLFGCFQRGGKMHLAQCPRERHELALGHQ